MHNPKASVNVDSATLVEPTRWHLPPDRMVMNCEESATTLADALLDERSVVPPANTPPLGDPAQARKLLDEADPRVLLMSLVHLTGDESLLDRFEPFITAQLAGGAKGVAQATIPEPMQEELRDRLIEELAQDSRPAGKPIPARLVRRMMSVCSGDAVGDEFVPFILEQAGFTGTQGVDLAARARPRDGFKVLIVGAGLSGIAMGIKLGEFGYDYEIIEKCSDVGGVWHINRYPGVGVDTPSHYYSYSYDINPDWPKYFSKGPILREYFQRAADRFGVRDHITFETEVLSARFDEAAGQWTVRLRDKHGNESEKTADIFVPAMTFTCAPAKPQFKGLDRFNGKVMHTAEWDESVELAGKRVAVIGTGASANQTATAIAPMVERLTVFQRDRQWISPAPLVGKDVPEGVRWALKHIPYYAQWQRFMTYWSAADSSYAVAVIDPDWPMQDLSVSEPNERRRQVFQKYIESELEGRPDLIEKVTPNYPPMGKRIILDHGWYRMLRRDNVDLDISGIAEITEDAIIAKDGTRVPVDVIVLATGFSIRPMIPTIEIFGRGGQNLDDVWGDDPRAYLGILVPGFPNMFVFNGPNTGPTHGAGQNLTAEATANYSLGLLDLMMESGAQTVECKPEAFAEYNAVIDRNLARMVWNHPKASSYYLNKNRRNTVSCPWRLVDYWWMTRRPEADDLVLTGTDDLAAAQSLGFKGR